MITLKTNCAQIGRQSQQAKMSQEDAQDQCKADISHLLSRLILRSKAGIMFSFLNIKEGLGIGQNYSNFAKCSYLLIDALKTSLLKKFIQVCH